MSDDGPGLASSLALWGMWLAVAVATWTTNGREPAARLYGVQHTGLAGGAGRVVTLLGWPVALAAIALATVALERLRVPLAALVVWVVCVLLCLTIALPGALDAKHLDPKRINAPAVLGVALAVLLTVWALRARGRGENRPWSRADAAWTAAFAVLLLAALPWLLANLGFYAGDVPGLHALFMSKQVRPEPGYPQLAAVHLGNHDGLDGLLLALTAVVLLRELPRMRRLRTLLGVYLAVLLPYGLAVAANDWWKEQVVKRGWASFTVRSVIRPSPSLPWAAILLAAALIWIFHLSRERNVPADRLTR